MFVCVGAVSVTGTVDPVLSRGSGKFTVPRRRAAFREIRVSVCHCNESSANVYWCVALLLAATQLAAWVDGLLERKAFIHDSVCALLFTFR